MVSFSFTLHDPEGFHAKAAGDLVEAALKCSSRVAIYVGGRTGDAKQIFNVMCLGAKNNDEVRMTVEGPEEETDSTYLRQVLTDRFGNP